MLIEAALDEDMGLDVDVDVEADVDAVGVEFSDMAARMARRRRSAGVSPGMGAGLG